MIPCYTTIFYKVLLVLLLKAMLVTNELLTVCTRSHNSTTQASIQACTKQANKIKIVHQTYETTSIQSGDLGALAVVEAAGPG
jgi:hypothetical protein